MKPQPIVFTWDGEVMRPLLRYSNVAARQFGAAGTQHVLEPTSERSMASHNQYFAALHDAWLNLPEQVSDRFPTENHFRKYLLIECRYFDQHEVACINKRVANETALFMRNMDDYARIAVHDNVVVIRRAKSQSIAAMGKEEFEASKKAVLELAEHFTGVSPGRAMKEAGKHA